jgi:hypothetical protein
MKKILILLTAAFSLGIIACNNSSKKSEEVSQNFHLDTTKLKSGESFYQCEMHHEINSDKMGICPDCKMDLTKIIKH